MFCKNKLLAVDMHQNNFLRVEKCGVFVTQNVWVEVLYTENVDIGQMLNNGAVFNVVGPFF